VGVRGRLAAPQVLYFAWYGRYNRPYQAKMKVFWRANGPPNLPLERRLRKTCKKSQNSELGRTRRLLNLAYILFYFSACLYKDATQ
jgi:hypothetical protein